jgi:hypothetical protein
MKTIFMLFLLLMMLFPDVCMLLQAQSIDRALTG